MRQRPAKMQQQQQQQQQRFQARSEGPAGSVGATEIDAQATTPFNTRHTGDDAGGVTLRTKNDAEQAMFEHYTRTHSEIDLEINAPALRGHFSANEFQSLYALLIDLSMHEPWTCPAPAAGAAAGERSGMRSSSSTSSTAGTGEPLAGSPSFVSVTVKAGQVAVIFLELRLRDVYIFAAAQHLGSKDTVVSIRAADMELDERTPYDACQ
eukprot:gene18219-2637_t